jgi:tryptophan synthase alpha subunit
VIAALKAGAKGVICGSAIIEAGRCGGEVTRFVHFLKLATRERLAYEMD